MADRHSETDEPELIADEAERALAEARNALRQFDAGLALLGLWLERKTPRLRPSDLLTLNRYALDGINRFAGTYRTTNIRISGSYHQPVEPIYVPAEVEDFCDYVNTNWETRNAVHLASYALWRVNWIHPFADGNGRTARIISYVILCAKVGYRLPGTNTIPEQISREKGPYYKALEAADRAFEAGRIDLSAMEELMDSLLARQLLSIHEEATAGHDPSSNSTRELETLPTDKPFKIQIEVLPQTSSSHWGLARKNLIERNPVLFGGIFAVLTSIISVVLTLLFVK